MIARTAPPHLPILWLGESDDTPQRSDPPGGSGS